MSLPRAYRACMKRRSFIAAILSALGVPSATARPPLVAAPSAIPLAPRVFSFDEVQLAGFQYHAGESVWAELAEGHLLVLVREPGNPFDRSAIRVDWQGRKLGYVPRASNCQLANLMDQGVGATARIVGLAECRNPWYRVQLAIAISVAAGSGLAAVAPAGFNHPPRSDNGAGNRTEEAGVMTAETRSTKAADSGHASDEAWRDSAGTAILVERLRREEDRVPREVIDACARSGDAMTRTLREVVLRPRRDGESSGDWWLRLHAVMILGLIPSAAAGGLLVEAMREMDRADDDCLQGWLSGAWPALFENKPESILPAVRSLAGDFAHHGYIRANAAQVVAAAAERDHQNAGDPEMPRRSNPWAFYEPSAIARRRAA